MQYQIGQKVRLRNERIREETGTYREGEITDVFGPEPSNEGHRISNTFKYQVQFQDGETTVCHAEELEALNRPPEIPG